MELTTTSRQRTTALNRLLKTTASAVRISMVLPLLFAFKSISIYLIAILAILCVQCIDCNAIPLPLSSSSSLLSSAYLSSVSSDNAATAERITFDRIAAAVQVNRVVNLTRQYSGDVFSAFRKYLHYFLFVFFSINHLGMCNIKGHVFFFHFHPFESI